MKLILDRYIIISVLSLTAVVCLVVLGVQGFIEFLGEMWEVGKGNYHFLQAALYVGMHLPHDLYNLFPAISFLGVLLGLGRLASHQELLAMQVAGVSRLKIMKAIIQAGLLIAIIVTLIGEGIAPHLSYKANELKRQALSAEPGKPQSFANNLWLQGHHAFIHIDVVEDKTHVQGLTRFQLNQKNELELMDFAKSAELQGDHWILYNVARSIFKNEQIEIKKIPTLPFKDWVFNPILLKENVRSADQQPLSKLFDLIKQKEKAGLNVSAYRFLFWSRIIQPVAMLAMFCLGVPFVFGSLRTASTGLRVLYGIIIGFAFYMLNQLFGPLAILYHIPPFFAALFPILFLVLIFLLLFYFSSYRNRLNRDVT